MSDLPPVPPGALPVGTPPADYPAGPPLAAPHPPVPPGAVRPGSPWPAPPAPDPAPPRDRRPWWVVVAGVLVVVALVAAVLAAFAGGDDRPATDSAVGREPRDRTGGTAAPTTDAPAPSPGPQDLEAVVRDIQDFVEQARGLTFQRDVTVELADDDEFEARLLEDFEEDVADLELQGRVLEAVGLVEPGTDLVEAMRTLLGAGVVGFYDPATDELVVRGTSTSPYVRTVIAHELVHALDDQHFELDRPALDDVTDETGFGFTALIEGNARRIEDAYRATFSAEEEEQAFTEELSIGSDVDLFGVPPVLFDLIGAPYVLGPAMVQAIVDAGGQERLDAAFALPPATSEHLLLPETYLAGEGPVPVEAPATDGGAAVVDEGMLGALGLAEILGLSPLSLPGAGIPDDVEGWGGDRYVAWDDADGSGTCLRAAIVGDTPEDTLEILDALDEWAASPPFGIDVTVDGDNGGADAVAFTSCSG
jgi:hypothetical protein